MQRWAMQSEGALAPKEKQGPGIAGFSLFAIHRGRMLRAVLSRLSVQTIIATLSLASVPAYRLLTRFVRLCLHLLRPRSRYTSLALALFHAGRYQTPPHGHCHMPVTPLYLWLAPPATTPISSCTSSLSRTRPTLPSPAPAISPAHLQSLA
jgi:hypothetical protein